MKAREVIAQYVYEDVLETAVHPSECEHHGDELLAALAREGMAVQSTDEVDARIEAAVAAERERCARIAEDFRHPNPYPTVYAAIAAAIREQNHDE